MGECYVKAYYDWVDQTAALDDAEKGRLFIAILTYAKNGEIPDLPGREAVLFPVFKAVLDRDAEKRRTNSENGSRGGRGNKANESGQKQNKANESEPKATKDIRQKTEDKRRKTEDGVKTRTERATPPTLESVTEYAEQRGSTVDPKQFWEYYNTGGWKDAKGNPVRNWKQKFLTWEKHETPKGAAPARAKTNPAIGTPGDYEREAIARLNRMVDNG